MESNSVAPFTSARRAGLQTTLAGWTIPNRRVSCRLVSRGRSINYDKTIFAEVAKKKPSTELLCIYPIHWESKYLCMRTTHSNLCRSFWGVIRETPSQPDYLLQVWLFLLCRPPPSELLNIGNSSPAGLKGHIAHRQLTDSLATVLPLFLSYSSWMRSWFQRSISNEKPWLAVCYCQIFWLPLKLMEILRFLVRRLIPLDFVFFFYPTLS